MHHTAGFSSQGGKGGGFCFPIGTGALIAPFDCHEGFVKVTKRRRRPTEGKANCGILGALDLLRVGRRVRARIRERVGDLGAREESTFAVDGRVKFLGEWVVDNADERCAVMGKGKRD